MSDFGAPKGRRVGVSDSGATAVGGNVSQSAGGDLAGRDLTKIDQQIINNIAQQVVNQAPAVFEAVRQLPGDVSDFTDREDVIAQIRGRLGVDGLGGGVLSRVALNGAPGVGKSALAIHAAHDLSGVFFDAQLYVNLAGSEGTTPVEPGEALAGFLRALGVSGEQIPAAVGEREAWYRSLLADRRGLVVLDNAGGEPQVRPLLPGGAGCAVLITSRAALVGIEGCWSYELPELDRDASLKMLAKILGTDRIDDERDQAGRIAELCGDLPLAIRICGALLVKRPGWRLDRLTAQLADERTRLERLQAGGLSVRTSFSVAYEQLPEPQRRLFRRLAVLPGQDFTPPAAAAVVEDELAQTEEPPEELLESPTNGRFAFHDLLRLYARERLAAEEPPETQQRIRTAAQHWYLGLAQASEQALTPDATATETDLRSSRAVVDFADAETDNLLAVARDAHAHQDRDTTIAFADALYNMFELRSRWDAWEQVNRLGLDAAERSDDRPAQGRMASHLGACLRLQSRWQEAIDAYQQSLTIKREFGDRHGEGQTLNNLGNVYQDQGRSQEAIDAYQQSLTIYREFGDRRGEGQTLNNLGIVYQHQGRSQEAIDALEDSAAAYEDAGDDAAEQSARNALGTLTKRETTHSHRRRRWWPFGT